MRFLSTFSGAECASLAWVPLGWQPVACAEVDPFCCALLAQRWPQVRNLGDVRRFEEWPDATFDVLAGGPPCQPYSLTGCRAGMDDPRGDLTAVYAAVAARYRPRWVVWENVPGILSTHGGRDFGAFLGQLAECGYGFAWRVLNAVGWGVPQRRRRVFLVGHLGNWRPAVACLFEPACLHGRGAQSAQAWEAAAAVDGEGDDGAGFDGMTVGAVSAKWHKGTGGPAGDETYNLVATPQGVRRLTVLECERLQGMPDHYTAITYRGKPAKDRHRYSAIGNAWPVPVVRWIGERIELVEQVLAQHPTTQPEEDHGTHIAPPVPRYPAHCSTAPLW